MGEAGVGKSRLLLEFRNRLPENEFTYHEGQCLQYGGSILYKPILDILRSLFDIKDDDREFIIRKKISECVSKSKNLEYSTPSFQDLLSVKVEDETFLKLEPKRKRERIFESLRDLLITVSHTKPLVLVVEDLHWIDETSEGFLEYFIEWIANTPIMLILLYRTEYKQKWSGKTYFHRIGLDHLRRDSSIELVKAMLEGGEVAPELRDLILARAAGNPLFMEEFTRTLIENGTIKKQDSQYVLSQKISDLQVPDTVQGIIAARMDRLEENLKRTMQVASVIGRDFAFRILQTITGMREELKSYLLNLQGLEFIYEKRLFPELEYIFKHALTQEVAYNSLLLKRRKQIHENIGKAIEKLYSERLEEFYEMLAYHYSKSDNLDKAYKYLKLSARKARNNYSNLEAYFFYKDAINMLNKLPHTEEHKKENIDISLLIYRPMAFSGFPEGSLDILLNGEKLSKELGDNESLTTFYTDISYYYTEMGKPVEGTNYVEPKFYKAQRDKDNEMMIRLSTALYNSYEVSGYHIKIIEILPKVINLIEKTKSESEYFRTVFNPHSYLCSCCGHSFAILGNFKKATKFLKKGHQAAYKINNIINIGQSEMSHGLYYLYKGDGKNAMEHFQRSKESFEAADYPRLVGLMFACKGYSYFLLGDLDAAKKNIEEGFGIHKKTSAVVQLSWYSIFLSHINHDLRNFSKAIINIEEALNLTMKHFERHVEGWARIWLGRILGKIDSSRITNAEEYIMQGIKILYELKYLPWLLQGYFFLGELYTNTDQEDEAHKNLDKALSMCKEMGIQYWPDKIQEVLDQL